VQEESVDELSTEDVAETKGEVETVCDEGEECE